MELRQLRHAIILAAERNFSRAAEKCNITQPALSKSISALETELGVRLFDRSGAGVLLTHSGTIFFEDAKKIVSETQLLKNNMSRIRDYEEGKLSFGMGPFPAGVFLDPVLAWLSNDNPKLITRLEMDSHRVLTENLLQRRIEFFIGAVSPMHLNARISVIELFTDSIQLYVRAGHPLLSATPVALDALQDFPVLFIYMDDEEQERLIEQMASKARVDLKPTIFCNHISSLKNAALRSDSVLLSFSHAVAGETARGELLPLKVSDQPFYTSDIGIVSLADRPFTAAATTLIAKIRELATAMA